ncbi:GNAT family N-acetyltransferase [Luedemannella helvata]|uniref:GNAT family N-acetyltransferase n=1 Tax=Luedemannella helvata TaxID=349315 RepID=A0ABP4WYP6_9ACTN
MTTTAEIRRIRSDEWPQLRELRLAALKDTPTAFIEAYDQSVRQPDDFWIGRAARGATDAALATFVAVVDGRFVGMTVAMLEADDDRVANLVGVYVSPPWRGRERGVTSALFDTAIGWVRAQGGTRRVQLYVTEGNERAAAFYRRYGFVPTGATVPYPPDPSIQEIHMELPGALLSAPPG